MPGFGCFIDINRTLNGSWGEISLQPLQDQDRSNLLLFDDSSMMSNAKASDGLQDYKAGLTYSSKGWLSRRIFVANRSERQFATFTYRFNGAVTLSLSILPAFALLILT